MKNKTLAELLSKKALNDQLYKCENCLYKVLNDNESWCYMFTEMFLGCNHFRFTSKEN